MRRAMTRLDDPARGPVSAAGLRQTLVWAAAAALLLSAAGLLARPASAASDVAKLYRVSGDVTVTRKQMSLPGQDNFRLQSDDKVKTMNGRATILFEDGTTIKMQTYTDIDIHKPPGGFLRSLKVFGGRLWARVRPTKDLQTQFESGTVITAIRGTVLEYAYDPMTGTLNVGVSSGSVVVYFMVGGEKQSVTVNAGEMLVLKIGFLPEKKEFKDGDIFGVEIEGEIQSFEIRDKPYIYEQETGYQGGAASKSKPR